MTEDERFDQLLKHWTILRRTEGMYLDYICLSSLPAFQCLQCRGGIHPGGLSPSTYADLATVAQMVMNRQAECMNRLLNYKPRRQA